MGYPAPLDENSASVSGTLRAGPPVSGHTIQRDEDHHTFILDHRCIPCTPAQYRVLVLLLEHVGECVSYARLIEQAQGYPAATSETVHTKQARIRLMHLVSDVRTKLWSLGLDIVAVMGTGYILLSAQVPQAHQTPYQE